MPRAIVDDAKAGSSKAQAKLAQQPKLERGNAYYLDAYHELQTEVLVDGGRIPGSAIKRWVEEDELDPLSAEAFHYIIRKVNDHERKREADKMAAEQEKAKKASLKKR